MRSLVLRGLPGAITVGLLLLPALARADEGMWLYNHPPRELLLKKYGFELTDAWLEHLQLSSVRPGASAEFVSQDGLVLSNHHVGSRAIQRLSTREHNYMRDGFYARTRAEELPCAGMDGHTPTVPCPPGDGDTTRATTGSTCRPQIVAA